MKQTIRFQRVSLFRRICSIIFDGIIAICLFVLLLACVSQPIISSATEYDQTYEKYNQELIDTNLFIYYEENQAVSLISTNYDKNILKFIEYVENNDLVFKIEEDITFNYESYYKMKYDVSNINPEYKEEPTFIYDEENDWFIDNSESENVKVFYQTLVTDLGNEILEQDTILGYTQKLTAYTMLMFFIAIIPTILILYLVVPLVNRDGSTIGKIMLQMRIIDGKTGKKANKFQLFIRFIFFALIDIVLGIFTYGLTIFISIIMIFIYKTRQSVHDVIAGTIVVRNTYSEQDKIEDKEIISITYDDGVIDEDENIEK